MNVLDPHWHVLCAPDTVANSYYPIIYSSSVCATSLTSDELKKKHKFRWLFQIIKYVYVLHVNLSTVKKKHIWMYVHWALGPGEMCQYGHRQTEATLHGERKSRSFILTLPPHPSSLPIPTMSIFSYWCEIMRKRDSMLRALPRTLT